MRRLRTSFVLGLGLALALSTAVAAAPASTTTSTTSGNLDTSTALVQLNGDPLSTYVKTKPTQGKKIDLTSNTTKSYRAQLSALRNEFKQWLSANAPKAKVQKSWDLAVNAVSVKLNGTTLAKLASAPMVRHVEYSGIYRPLDNDDPDLSLIRAQAAWAATGGAAGAGQGVKIAMLDTGIDVNHPCFDDTGYPTQAQLGDARFTNNKVIVAKVFKNTAAKNGWTAEAIHYHGTHTAATAACNLDTPVNIDGIAVPYDMSGVAPRALLGNYNVFPGPDSDSRSEDLIDALEAAYTDGMDVANMSLGGGAGGVQDLVTMAIDDLDQANFIVAVAAGNAGDGSDTGEHPFFPPGHYTIESPGSAARALTAGSYTVGHQIVSGFEIGGTTYIAQPGDFETVDAALTAPTAIMTSGTVNGASGFSEFCDVDPDDIDLTGQIAMIGRGTCDFEWKIRTAELAGAVGVIMVNRLPGDPIPMGRGASPDGEPATIPAYMISLEDGIYIREHQATGDAGTITLPFYYDNNHDYIQSSFSGQGPTDVDYRVKPDVMAPGENVISAIPASWCDAPPCFAFLNGTSMATPHLAGGAAVVKGAHPDWSAAQIRSAIVNTAAQGLITQNLAPTVLETDVNIVGAGSEDLLAAVDAWVALDPVSLSFGAVPHGSGQTATLPVVITNLRSLTHTYTFSIAGGGSGVAFSLNVSAFTLTPGESKTILVTMTADKGATLGDHQAQLNVSGIGSQCAHMALYTFIK